MSLIITHGYLLTGTGSNLYVNNLVRELVKKGVEVNLFCQDFDPLAIDFVNQYYEFDNENEHYHLVGSKNSPFKGVCRVFKPNLNGLLPVYVYDHYEGYTVKEFPNCSDAEVEAYTIQNQKALEKVVQDFKVEVINTNHLVQFPYIATQVKKKFDLRHVITIHGSALNFTVKNDKRFEEFAKEALINADEIVVDSHHADVEIKEFLDDVELSYLKEKVDIIPAGVDISSFDLPTASKSEMISTFQKEIGKKVPYSKGRTIDQTNEILYNKNNVQKTVETAELIKEKYDYRHVDQDVIQKVETLKEGSHTIMFVGKYLWTKGLHLILSGIPKVLKEYPNAKYVFVGFGPYREVCEVLINAMAQNKLDDFISELDSNDFFKGNDGVVKLLKEVVQNEKEEIASIISEGNIDIRKNIVFTGIAEHKELVKLLPAMDVLIAPSVFPEAFGMVAIEAMACGVYPVLTYQSAFQEISDEVIETLENYSLEIEKVLLDEKAAGNIAKNIIAYFKFKASQDQNQLNKFKEELRQVVIDKYSWEGIAQKYLEVYAVSTLHD